MNTHDCTTKETRSYEVLKDNLLIVNLRCSRSSGKIKYNGC